MDQILRSASKKFRFELPHDKTNKMACGPSEDSDQPGHPPSLIRVFTVRMKKAWALTTHWAHSEDSDQTGRMPRLIWIFAGRIVTLLVLSQGGSFVISTSVSIHVFLKSIQIQMLFNWLLYMSHNMTKPTKWLGPAKIQISLGIHPVWSESSLSAWGKLGPLATHWEHSEDSDQTGRMPRLIWVFTGRTLTLLVLSCHGSYILSSVFFPLFIANCFK